MSVGVKPASVQAMTWLCFIGRLRSRGSASCWASHSAMASGRGTREVGSATSPTGSSTETTLRTSAREAALWTQAFGWVMRSQFR